MLTKWNCLHIARISVEALTPLSIQTGQGLQNYDTSLVRDANGLPTLPATSIRGVLRHLFTDLEGEAAAGDLFGRGGNMDESQTSRLQVSWGLLHDCRNQAINGRVILDGSDDVLDELSQIQPIKRERVRLTHRGTAEENGKFDIVACPAGVRFTFELKYWSEQTQDYGWQQLLALVSSAQFRLGHSTRSGFGALKVIAAQNFVYDFKKPEDVSAWQTLQRDIQVNATDELPNVKQALSKLDEQETTIHIALKADDFVRVGGGDRPVHQAEDDADLMMQSEKRIQWHNNTGKFSKAQPLIPASSIKGALAHRFSYHVNRIKGQYANDLTQSELDELTKRSANDEAIALFGNANDSEQAAGQAGKLFLNDVYLPDNVQTSQLWHNRIDRFTGGVIDGALFTEEVLFEPAFEFELTVSHFNDLSNTAKQALKATLDDLCSGLLPLGAGGARGLGAFTGAHSLDTIDLAATGESN